MRVADQRTANERTFPTMTSPQLGAWLSDDNAAVAEIVAKLGYDFVILDIEHGPFDLVTLEKFIPLLKGLGLTVLAKTLAPERGPISQPLDFGADGVIIPHIESVEHARKITSFAKFPPLGDRSAAGGRTVNYGGFSDEWYRKADATTMCFPMIEDAGAFDDVAEILALDTVDGVFIGPTDLSLRRGRGSYSRTEEDFADIAHIAAAAAAAGKPWVLPAWSPEEKQLAIKHGAAYVALTMVHGAITEGFSNAKRTMDELVAG